MRGGPYSLAPGVLEILTAFDWRDGNVRELRNCLRSMTEKSANQMLTPNSLPKHVWKAYLNSGSVDTRSTINPGVGGREGLFLSWTDKNRPNFQKLCATLLLELIQSDSRDRGRLSMRSLAKSCGIPKSSLPAKLRKIIDFGLITKSEMEQMLCFGLALQD
jgi:DNA-binding NtrC family response regulator